MVRKRVSKVKKDSVVKDFKLLKLKERALVNVSEEHLKKISRFKAFDFILKYADVTPEGRLIVNRNDIVKRVKVDGGKIHESSVSHVIDMLEHYGADILSTASVNDSLVSKIKPLSEKGRRVKFRDTAALRAIEKFAEKKNGKVIVDVKAVYDKSKPYPNTTTTYGKIYNDAVYLRKLGYNVEIKNYRPPKRFISDMAAMEKRTAKKFEFELHAVPKSDSQAVRYFLAMGESKEQILRRFPFESRAYWEDLVEKQIRKKEKKSNL